jgi:hypothetical protein
MVVESDIAVQGTPAPTFSLGPISNQPQDVKLAPQTSVTLTTLAVSEGAPANLKYQWILNGIPVPGATSPVYTFAANFNTKGTYTVAATNEGGTTISDISVVVQVEDVPDITFVEAGTRIMVMLTALTSPWVVKLPLATNG